MDICRLQNGNKRDKETTAEFTEALLETEAEGNMGTKEPLW